MFRFSDRPFTAAAAAVLVTVAGLGAARAVDEFTGVGRQATPAEIKAWNIDVRPDFLGLPKGSGTVARGEELWEAKCASCHGTFGESNKIFTPLVGGVEKGDLETGHVASLKRTDFPARTTFMKVATISTIFDYIKRAMPWNAPKSLSDDDVYAVLAYLLNLSDIVDADFVLDDQTIRDVQKIMPNRNGMTWQHAMWPSPVFSGRPLQPDTQNKVCMKDCKKEVEVASTLPDYALNSHGNLADQNRRVGPVRGQVTGPSVSPEEASSPAALAEANGCLGCHAAAQKVVGPSYQEVAAKYKGQDALAKLVAKVRQGGEGVWGDVAMPPQEEIKDEDLKKLVAWILQAAPGN
jgi:cytochrome c